MEGKRAKVIAICNQKGGTGKTTTTLNLGVGLAREGYNVLLIDADSQGDLTTCLGQRDLDNQEVTLATLMEAVIRDEPLDVHHAILHHPERVHFIPANIELSAMEMLLINAMNRENTLKTLVEQVKPEYDYILIDCMPSLGMLTINVMAAADSVIIPVQAHYLSAKGMTQLIKTISKVKRQINPSLTVDGVLLTLADMRTVMARQTASLIEQQYGAALHIYNTIIPVGITAAETSSAGMSIYRYDGGGKVAAAYAALTKEVLTHGKKDSDGTASC